MGRANLARVVPLRVIGGFFVALGYCVYLGPAEEGEEKSLALPQTYLFSLLATPPDGKKEGNRKVQVNEDCRIEEQRLRWEMEGERRAESMTWAFGDSVLRGGEWWGGGYFSFLWWGCLFTYMYSMQYCTTYMYLHVCHAIYSRCRR